MTYDLYVSISIHKVLHIIYSFCYCIALSIVLVTKRELSSFFIMSSFALIRKGLIIVTVILVIAAIEGMCIFLLHWFAIHVQS